MAHRNLPGQILTLLRQGVMPAGALQKALAASPATIRRALDDLGPQQILRIGQGRATRYGVRRIPSHGVESSVPLYEVSPQGTMEPFATLHALASDQWYLEPIEGHNEHPMQVGSERGVFAGLPWFLETARPQGFLGRLFAQKAHRLAQFPLDPTVWTDDHVLAAALMLGDDLPGNILVGAAALRHTPAPPTQLPLLTDALMESAMQAVLNGEVNDSFVGGEQPKFTLSAQTDRGPVHRIVKFSPEMETVGTRRWGDLLVAEHVANEVLRAAGIASASTHLRCINNRMYLESDRFDRPGEGTGRQGMTALAPLAYTLGYGGIRWNEAAQLIAEAQALTPAQVARIQFIQDFGRGIGNTDMHLGNMSLLGSITRGWDIAPVYDMTPMAYIPGRTMEVAQGTRTLPVEELPSAVAPWVRRFWKRLAADPQVSADFQAIARHHAQTLEGGVAEPVPFVAPEEAPAARRRLRA